MQTLTIKRGDTFAFIAILYDKDTGPIIGAAANLRCQVRDDSDKLFGDLTVTEVIGEDGHYLFKTADTSTWSGTLYTDIEYTNGEITTSTETMEIKVTKDVTTSV